MKMPSIKMTKTRYVILAVVVAMFVIGHFFVVEKAYEMCRKTDTTAHCMSTIKWQIGKFYLNLFKEQ